MIQRSWDGENSDMKRHLSTAPVLTALACMALVSTNGYAQASSFGASPPPSRPAPFAAPPPHPAETDAFDPEPFQVPAGAELARGIGGVLTEDAVAAYLEALEFVLGQLGQPTRFDQATRATFMQRLAQGFPMLPADTQQALAGARALWSQYRSAWNAIGANDQRAFAYDVLALAYGDEAASRALGTSPSHSASGEHAGLPDVDGGYAGDDCWAAAGCSYDSGTGDYSYEDFGSYPQ